MERSAALRNRVFSFENAFSMGLKSGLYGGRYSSLAPTLSIISRTLGPLWLDRLSMTMTSPGRSSGSNTFSTYVSKMMRLTGLSMTKGAMKPRNVSAPMKVVVFQ